MSHPNPASLPETAVKPQQSRSLEEKEKIRRIAHHFEQIMITLGLNLEEDGLRNTPERVAKMYVKEIFQGLDVEQAPYLSLFDNPYEFDEMLLERDISLYSYCEHHFVPIIGQVHVAYFPKEKIIGLSKINRLVKYLARRPQVQERLTTAIATQLKETLGHDDVAVIVDAEHLCVNARGVEDTNSRTMSFSFSGRFEDPMQQQLLLSAIAKK